MPHPSAEHAPDSTPLIRGLRKLWSVRPPVRVDAAANPAAPLLDRVLAVRGLGDAQAAQPFLNPSLMQLHDPSLIPDLDRAAARILDALRAGDPIVIYGDYDVDGITATAILYHTLLALRPGGAVRTYVPHRIDEGYGLNAAALQALAREGARVVVSVDCGITAVAPARAAKDAGLDLIITDHHNPPATLDELPAAYAVVHPRRPDSRYPFGDLSGAGVAYKLAWRLATLHSGGQRVSAELRALLIDLLALAALGAVADVMPLLGENRVIARFGLARVKHSSIPGLRALVEASGLAGENIGSEHAGFALGPRLNACGRMGHAREAVELLTTATGEQAASIAARLSALNDQRRRVEQHVAAQAAEMAEAAGMTGASSRAIVLAHDEWHLGVLGIACSRLVERFHRPTILMQRAGGACHGSGRSIEGFSLHGALHACAEHLTTFGGHDMAAGLKLDDHRLPAFTEAFAAHAADAIAPERLIPALRYDTPARLDELVPSAVGALDCLAPFGVANPRPRVLLQGLAVVDTPTPFGSGGKHVGIVVRQRGHAVRLVAWNWADRLKEGQAPELRGGMTLDAVVSPKLSTWTGRTSVEPELDDLRIA